MIPACHLTFKILDAICQTRRISASDVFRELYVSASSLLIQSIDTFNMMIHQFTLFSGTS
jgi:hypothetical protein